MTFREIFCLHARQVPLGITRAIAIPVSIVSAPDILPLLSRDEPQLPILLFHAKLFKLLEA